MRVFLSWSGDVSKAVALALRDWLPSVINTVKTYMSARDVEVGARWLEEITRELDLGGIGVFCLTKQNIASPWILFEAGALATGISTSRLTPLVIDMNLADITGPLSQFQGCTLDRDSMLHLVSSINSCMKPDQALEPECLQASFNKWWPEIDEVICQIMNDLSEPDARKKPQTNRELLERIYTIVSTSPPEIQNVGDSPDIVYDSSELETYHSAKMHFVKRFKEEILRKHLSVSEGNVSKAANSLGLSRQAFMKMAKDSGVNPSDYIPVER
ncbi:MAG: TIR domain-containing protein [bacterium]|nr:TIR domain-containing protein [bacterium]